MFCLNCQQLNDELAKRCENLASKLINYIVDQNRDLNKTWVYFARICHFTPIFHRNWKQETQQASFMEGPIGDFQEIWVGVDEMN